MEAGRQSTRACGVQCPKERRESAGSLSHLRPLSSCSRKIVCDRAGGWPGFHRNLSAPFCNIKVEIVNRTARASLKRRLDDAGVEEGPEAPLRKRLALDSPASGSGAGRGGLSGESRGPPSPVRPPNAPRLTMIRKAGPGAGLGRPASGRESGFGGTDAVVSRASSRDQAVAPTPLPRPESPAWTQTPGELDVDHAFDFDIEDILSLSPICSGESDDSEGIEAFIESCHSFYERSCVYSPTGPARSPSGPAHSPSGPAHSPSGPAHSPSGPAHSPSGSAHSPSSPAHTSSSPAHTPSGHAQGAGLGGKVGGDSGKGAVSFDEGYFSRRGGSGGEEIKARPLQSTPLALAKGLPSSNLQQASVDGGGALPSPVAEPAVCRNLLAEMDHPSSREGNTAFLADVGEPPAKLYGGPALPAVQVSPPPLNEPITCRSPSHCLPLYTAASFNTLSMKHHTIECRPFCLSGSHLIAHLIDIFSVVSGIVSCHCTDGDLDIVTIIISHPPPHLPLSNKSP